MKSIRVHILLLNILFSVVAYAQLSNPKYEMRGIWIASLGIDWPANRGTSAGVINLQKTELTALLDKHKNHGMNAMFFHVRPTCDAVYKSAIEPWSSYLTGTQGLAPADTSYDPLKFAITEAHKRGMELHAWLNPYRALLSSGSTANLSANHIIKTKPSWIIKCNGTEYRFLNPGLPEVRAYVVKVVMDIVRRYNVDGIHFDDYFYPYSSYGTFNDDAAFAAYKYGFTDRAAWRTNNVNLLLKALKDSIHSVKPYVKFGISPSGNPSVNTGIYCSPSDWLSGKYVDTTGTPRASSAYIDYIMPQLYWVNFNGQLPNWSGQTFLNNRFMYIGHAAYRFEESGFPADECSKQIQTSRVTNTSRGGVYFSSKSVTGNLASCADTMQRHYYSNPAVNHKMNWKTNDETPPKPPTNLRSEYNASLGKFEIKWDAPLPAADGDTAFNYIVYRYASLPGIPAYGSNIAAVTGENYLRYTFGRFSTTQGAYYSVSCFDRYGNESQGNPTIQLDTTGNLPSAPTAKFPANLASINGTATQVRWTKSTKAETYLVQICTNPAFTGDTVYSFYEIKDTVMYFAKIQAGKRYYWRVKSANLFGHSSYSSPQIFQSGTPIAPLLAAPANNATNVFLNATFAWMPHFSAVSYQLQLSSTVDFTSSSLVFDQLVTDTVYRHNVLLGENQTYYWRVKSKNAQGESSWGTIWTFKTGTTISNEAELRALTFSVDQNYPNPFNNRTRIRFTVDVQSRVTAEIYDVIGNLITTVYDKEVVSGSYETEWDGTDSHRFAVPSGMYFVKIMSGTNSQIKKMILLK